MDFTAPTEAEEYRVHVIAGAVKLEGTLGLPRDPRGIVMFAHGSGSSRHSPRNRYVAERLRSTRFATLLLDLLTPAEETIDTQTRELRFDIDLLAERVTGAAKWLAKYSITADLPRGLFGASTGAAAALVTAAQLPDLTGAVVSRGGRPDLADPALAQVRAPTLLIVGGNDAPVIDLNHRALDRLGTPQKELIIVPGASHLFVEPGTLEQVASLAANWFLNHLGRLASTPAQ